MACEDNFIMDDCGADCGVGVECSTKIKCYDRQEVFTQDDITEGVIRCFDGLYYQLCSLPTETLSFPHPDFWKGGMTFAQVIAKVVNCGKPLGASGCDKAENLKDIPIVTDSLDVRSDWRHGGGTNNADHAISSDETIKTIIIKKSDYCSSECSNAILANVETTGNINLFRQAEVLDASVKGYTRVIGGSGFDRSVKLTVGTTRPDTTGDSISNTGEEKRNFTYLIPWSSDGTITIEHHVTSMPIDAGIRDAFLNSFFRPISCVNAKLS